VLGETDSPLMFLIRSNIAEVTEYMLQEFSGNIEIVSRLQAFKSENIKAQSYKNTKDGQMKEEEEAVFALMQ